MDKKRFPQTPIKSISHTRRPYGIQSPSWVKDAMTEIRITAGNHLTVGLHAAMAML